jgi:LuxR family maltose regulon positive regulatory protein
VVTALLNALAHCPSGGILVLEDYHVITEPSIHETFSFFLEHLPPALHLVIITRRDPPFSLARLRVRNRLYEVRAADLRFSQEESASLLHQSLPFALSASTLERLYTQSEAIWASVFSSFKSSWTTFALKAALYCFLIMR